MQRRGVGPAVDRLDPDARCPRGRLGVLDHDVEVAVLVEDAGVDQLELGVLAVAAPVLLDQPR